MARARTRWKSRATPSTMTQPGGVAHKARTSLTASGCFGRMNHDIILVLFEATTIITGLEPTPFSTFTDLSKCVLVYDFTLVMGNGISE